MVELGYLLADRPTRLGIRAIDANSRMSVTGSLSAYVKTGTWVLSATYLQSLPLHLQQMAVSRS
jgi:hypothetical protein